MRSARVSGSITYLIREEPPASMLVLVLPAEPLFLLDVRFLGLWTWLGPVPG